MPSSTAVSAPAPLSHAPTSLALALRESRQQVVAQFLRAAEKELDSNDLARMPRRVGSWIGDQLPETNANIVRALQLADALNLSDEAIHWIDLPVAHLVNIVLPELEDRHRAFLNAKGTAN